jgi:hypothetical protein
VDEIPYSEFYAAFIDGGAKHVVLGRKLRPFSHWHAILLEAVQSPYIKKGNVTLFDLKTAVGICRLKYGDSKIRRSLFPLRINQKRLIKENQKLLDYFGDCLQSPRYSAMPFTSESHGHPAPKGGSPPDILSVVADVISWSGWPEEYVWNLPIGRCRWYRAMAQADKQPLDFLTPAEVEFQNQMKEAGIEPYTG